MSVPMRVPQDVGEILSDALAYLRRHFRTYALVALPFVAGDLLLRETGSVLIGRARATMGADPAQAGVDETIAAMSSVLAAMSAYGLSILVTQVLGLGVVLLAAQAWRGELPTPGPALKKALTRAPAALGTAALAFALFAASLVPSILVLVGAAVLWVVTEDRLITGSVVALSIVIAATAIVVVTLRVILYTCAVVLEGRSLLGAISRSAELVAARGERLFQGAKWRLSLLLLVSFGLGFTMQGLFALPRWLLASAVGWDTSTGLPPITALPVYFGAPLALLEVATNSVVYPFTSILVTLFYFDLRVRYEAVDMERVA